VQDVDGARDVVSQAELVLLRTDRHVALPVIEDRGNREPQPCARAAALLPGPAPPDLVRQSAQPGEAVQCSPGGAGGCAGHVVEIGGVSPVLGP
jgi:hypothetical protein